MIILLSPAKRLNFRPEPVPLKPTEGTLNAYAASIMDEMQYWSLDQTRRKLNLSEQLGEIAYNRNKQWALPGSSKLAKPAIYAYYGDVFQAMDPRSFDRGALNFAVRHLRILSALYGILLPSDLVKPYRLQMSTPISVHGATDLYHFWSQKLTDKIECALRNDKTGILINLASEEYFQVIDTAKLRNPIIKPVFKQFHEGRHKVLSLYTKRARGYMTRFIIENRIVDPEHLKAFDMDGYQYAEDLSTTDRWIFLKSVH
jgi:cytoplasmic iron level regulating protein YaaA (DUF328/UPF0246 family)